MDIDRLKQKAHMSGQFAGLTGPSEQDLADIESEDVGTGAFTSEQIEGLRRMNEKIDPAYARQRNKAGTKFSDTAARTTAGGAKRATAADALANIESAEGVRGMGGLIPGKEVVSSDFDPADYRRSMSGVGVTSAPSHFAGTRGTQAHAEGVFLLRTAGRCNHIRCQMIRAKGMELLGADTRMQLGGKHYWESSEPEIPSVATEEKYYPMVGGKESRKDVRTTTVLSPADPKHPEWVSLQAQAKSGHSLLQPSDLLAHHHGPEDDDFEKYPLPF